MLLHGEKFYVPKDGQFKSDCLWAPFWLSMDHEDFNRVAMNPSSPKNTSFYTVLATTSASTDDRKDA